MLTIERLPTCVQVDCFGQRLLRYQVDTTASKPHFDVVALPPGAGARAGENLVLAAPHDRPWHLGLFLGQRFVDGIDFWKSEALADRKAPHGYCRPTSPARAAIGEDGSVSFEHNLDWRAHTGETLLRETRLIRVLPPVAHHYRIDWTTIWTAIDRDRTLSGSGDPREHEDPENTGHEQHASGLSYRPLRCMYGGQVVTSEGTHGMEAVLGQRARWADYTGRLDGQVVPRTPDEAGLAILDHPRNPDHPVRWSCMTEPHGFLAANRTFDGSWRLSKDEPATLQYAIVVHAGPVDRWLIEEHYEQFIASMRANTPSA